MINFDALKPVAKRLKKEWQTLDVGKVAASKHPHGVILKCQFKTFSDEKATMTALLTPAINPTANVNLILDILLPQSQNLEPLLPSLSAFMQQATAQLSPVSLLVDMRSQQLVVRQAQVMGLNYPINTIPFYNASQLLIPLIQRTVESMHNKPPSQEEARNMADLLSESFYGALTE